MDFVTILGFVAGALVVMGYVPQVLKSLRTRRTRDLSLPMFLTISTGTFLWLVYGVYVDSWPIIITNLLILVLASVIAALKFVYK